MSRSTWTQAQKSICNDLWAHCAVDEPNCEEPCEWVLQVEKEGGIP